MGAVAFIQRFGSAMNLNLHFHTLAFDGIYSGSVSDREPPRFSPLPPPSAQEVARVPAGTARRIHRLIERRAADDEDALARDEPLLALLAAASLQTRIATRPEAGMPWRRLGDRVEPAERAGTGSDPDASPRVPRHGGMSLHADVCVPARDRARLERLCRYVARPPLAQERLEERSDGSLALRLKTRWRDGTTHILMEKRELIERLVPLIPPPRANQVRYHGILAPAASLRDRITPRASDEFEAVAPRETGAARASGAEPDLREEERGRAYRIRWAKLLMRVFEIDALRCPRCGATRRLLAAIADPEVASKILACLDLPAPTTTQVLGVPRRRAKAAWWSSTGIFPRCARRRRERRRWGGRQSSPSGEAEGLRSASVREETPLGGRAAAATVVPQDSLSARGVLIRFRSASVVLESRGLAHRRHAPWATGWARVEARM